MRMYLRTSRSTGLSLGCLGTLLAGPVIALAWAAYIAVMLVYALSCVAVHSVRAAQEEARRRNHG